MALEPCRHGESYPTQQVREELNYGFDQIKGWNSMQGNWRTHTGKSGVVKDIHTSKTGHLTITVLQASGERFKTLANNVAEDK